MPNYLFPKYSKTIRIHILLLFHIEFTYRSNMNKCLSGGRGEVAVFFSINFLRPMDMALPPRNLQVVVLMHLLFCYYLVTDNKYTSSFTFHLLTTDRAYFEVHSSRPIQESLLKKYKIKLQLIKSQVHVWFTTTTTHVLILEPVSIPRAFSTGTCITRL